MSDSIAFDRAAGYYDETRGFPPGEEKAVATLIGQAGNLNRNSRILEIGVGTGRIALPLAQHAGEIAGLDLSRPMLERLRAKQNGESVYPVQGDATRLPFVEHAFDAVVAVHVFHLIPNWQGVIAELQRVLRPGGPVLHCWTDNDPIFVNLWSAWRAVLPPEQTTDVGMRWERNATFLEELGWKRIQPEQIHTFSQTDSAQKFIERLQNRILSQTWRLSDDELARGVEAVQALIQTEYPDPTAPIPITMRFHVQTYTPPV
jgi:ubiquinone/menaquinone biosynthesis C-methylase UbiE